MRGELLTCAERSPPMPATLPQVVKPFQQDWPSQLEPAAFFAACRGVAYRWRERTRNPVTTLHLFLSKCGMAIRRACPCGLSPRSP
jgi:hypothetical protein